MHEAILSLGGNLGEVRATLDCAVDRLCDGSTVRPIARSSFYRTPPWGDTDQPPFINLCLIVATTLMPRALLARGLAVETSLGRDRARERRWGPRRIDIDILAYDDLTVDEPGLRLPHPRLFERAFVLIPLAEIAPERRIAGVEVRHAAARVDGSGIVRLCGQTD